MAISYIYLIFAGIVALLAGFLFLSGKAKVKKTSDTSQGTIDKKIISVDNFFLNKHVGIGLTLLIISVFLFFMAYYISCKV